MTNRIIPAGMRMLPSGIIVPASYPANWSFITAAESLQVMSVTTQQSYAALVKNQKICIDGVLTALPSSAVIAPGKKFYLQCDVENTGGSAFSCGVLWYVYYITQADIMKVAMYDSVSNPSTGDYVMTSGSSLATIDCYLMTRRTINPGSSNALTQIKSNPITVAAEISDYYVATYVYRVP